MAGDFDIKINIKTVLDGAGGLDEIVAKLKELQEAAAQVQAEGAEGGIVSPEAVARMNAALAGLTSGLGSGAAEAAAAAGEAGEAAAEAIAEASAEAGEAAGEAAEEAAETTADAAGEAAEAASDAAEESAEAAEEAAEQSSEAYIAGLEGLDEKLKEVAEDGGIDVLNLSGAFDSLKGAISGALGALTAYASYSGLKGLTESIISTGADFEATMLQVKAVTGATEEQYERMGEAANRLGAETEFSGKQAAQALNFLTSAGLDVDQALSALAGTLDLASAGALDLGTAADIATSILSGMGLEVERLGRVNDVLVKTVNTSNTSLTELGEAFKVVGPTANSLGYDIETISALLGQLANAGIRGSTAGTSLNAALLATQKAFDHYGVSAKNADGTTKDFVDALDLLREKGAGATVVSDIFGQAALKSVLSLQQSVEKDADSVREAIRSVRDESDGAALAAAETMRQGFKVVMDELGGALEGIGSASFERFLDPLKEAIRGVTEAVDHASPQFQKFTDGLMKAAVTGFKALAWLVEAGEWFQKSAVTTGLMTSAIVLLGTKITVVLVKAVSGFIVSLGRALVASASVTAQIKAGTVTAEQAAAMQKVLDGAYSAGMIPKGAYTSMTRQLTAVQNREALGTRALSVALREEAAAATAAATAGGAVAASSGAVAAASGAAAAALASETAAAGAASAALAAEGVAETGNVAATARETVASGAAATALRAEAGAAGTAAAALTGEASAAATAAAANAAVATTSRAAAGGLAAEGVAAGGAAAGLTAAGTAAGAAAGRMGLLRGAMMMLGGPVGLALIGIASLAGVLSYLKDSAQNAKQAIIDQNAAFIDAAKSVADYHGELVKLHEEQRKGVDISERLAQAAKAYAESKGASPELVALGVTATPEDTEKEQLRALYKARDSIRESMRAELQRDFDDGARWTPIGADTLKGLDDFVAKLRKKVDEARAEQAKFLAGESFDTAQVLKLPQLEKDLAEADERLNKRKETIRAAQVAELNTYTDLLMQMVQNKALSAEYAEKLFQDALTDMKDQISTEGLDFDELFG
ncbi:MAG: phage tail tape measure protein, partial [Deltaproteobacteria bacterium]|nr:phage tail tape measure protein [Deltaproteobacteria bacterium]